MYMKQVKAPIHPYEGPKEESNYKLFFIKMVVSSSYLRGNQDKDVYCYCKVYYES